MAHTPIDSITALEAVMGETPSAMHMKVIDHLDTGALRWIAQSPFTFACFSDEAGGVDMTIGGGTAGFTTGDAQRLRLPVAALDGPVRTNIGAAFGSLFLLPGIGETLRVNGRVAAVGDDQIEVEVIECYGHCAKAIIRSELWKADPAPAPMTAEDFVAASRFLALATVGTNGHADLSPKGDPAGCMAQLDGDRLWFVDRPGNRRIDSFRNIVEQPSMALILIAPGVSSVMKVRGCAYLTTDIAVRERFTVREKTPVVAIAVRPDAMMLDTSSALERLDLWPVRRTSDIDPSRLFMDHVKLNRSGGLGASLARASLSVPGMKGLLKRGLEKDYKDNLY